VLAAVVRLLETTYIRVGNEEYARTNQSFGLTTLRNHHVHVNGATLEFEFRGKSGKQLAIKISDRRLANIVKRCQELPGQVLFEYLDDDGTVQTVDSDDVNTYLREISGQDFTAKDFRTWGGTVLALQALQESGAGESHTASKKNIVQAIAMVADQLGNTPAVCRKCYVHPVVLEAYMDQSLFQGQAQAVAEVLPDSPYGLRADETAVLRLLQQRLAQEQAEH
jgi:DNA topoisomerase-1